ncbi:hypothetical protein [Haloarchaeobius iranensis]|uniref:Sulfatase n=1 Tax=Haloarchaeobius iranensis TaxID=996166 RepID=A0A1G9UM87_9EURY|nr:hypothetical protein [Haloarchaeobius iranensis]SDM60977.1 hypothetical protein SAMN05192554_104204 [Haloarchaeobius iranensis]
MLRHDLNLDTLRKGLQAPDQAFDATVYELFYRIPATYLNTLTTIGTNVFDEEWDVLLILDTCRVDALREVADEYDFLGDVGKIRSVGGRSPEWIAKTFHEDYRDTIAETAYLSANVYTDQILEDREHETIPLSETNLSYRLLGRIPNVDVDALGRCEYLFTYEGVGEEGPLGHVDGGTPPRYVTDRGIAVWREHDFDRMILHYLQPHSPYMANGIDEDRPLEQYETDWWGYLAETNDKETVWNAYLDELRYVLDDVELLLENLDAGTVAISSDHGEAFGEYWEFGHNNGSLHPHVRTVPWVTTTAEDRGEYTPVHDPPGASQSKEELDRQLEALGYK